MKPLKSGRANIYSRPLASKSGGAFALPALQLVPPLIDTAAVLRLTQGCTVLS